LVAFLTQWLPKFRATQTEVVTISRIICYARVLILAGKSDARAEKKPKDKKQSKMKFLVKKI
jgi:hypothetical protein